MPLNKDFAQRLEILDTCLRRNLRRWDAEALLREINRQLQDKSGKSVSRRTLFEDLKHLRDVIGAPVAKERKEDGHVYYEYSDPNYSIKKLPLTTEDVTYLKEAAELLRQISGFQIMDDVDNIIGKLEHAAASNELSATAILFERHSTAAGTEHLDNLLQAIKGKTALNIAYQPFGLNEPLNWTIHPYLLKEFRGRWFLIGRKDDAGITTTLALDRIRKLKPEKTPFIPNDLFQPETFFEHLIGVSLPEGEEVQDIRIRVYGRQCYYIKTKPLHKSQEIVEEFKETDCMDISLRLINNYELRSLLLSYGPDIELLSPEKLRIQVAELLTDGAKRYS